ncbi:MAG: L-rhamnose mutarotase [Alphaproteobacteria bacterium]|nr:L-rhamnose mutarotase [Alphaproteobacteria bacterium]
MQRIAKIIQLKPEAIDEYKKIHAEVWPGVLATIAACQIRNYSIFLREPENLLFAYFEYHGTDFEADMAKMAIDETTQRWWKITDPMQTALDSAAEGEWWASTEMVFHQD